jgi:hypothetical protein
MAHDHIILSPSLLPSRWQAQDSTHITNTTIPPGQTLRALLISDKHKLWQARFSSFSFCTVDQLNKLNKQTNGVTAANRILRSNQLQECGFP